MSQQPSLFDKLSMESWIQHFKRQAEMQTQGTHSYANTINKQTGNKGESIILIGSSGAHITATAMVSSITGLRNIPVR